MKIAKYIIIVIYFIIHNNDIYSCNIDMQSNSVVDTLYSSYNYWPFYLDSNNNLFFFINDSVSQFIDKNKILYNCKVETNIYYKYFAIIKSYLIFVETSEFYSNLYIYNYPEIKFLFKLPETYLFRKSVEDDKILISNVQNDEINYLYNIGKGDTTITFKSKMIIINGEKYYYTYDRSYKYDERNINKQLIINRVDKNTGNLDEFEIAINTDMDNIIFIGDKMYLTVANNILYLIQNDFKIIKYWKLQLDYDWYVQTIIKDNKIYLYNWLNKDELEEGRKVFYFVRETINLGENFKLTTDNKIVKIE